MNDHLARYRQIKQTQLNQLNILNKFHNLLNAKNIAIKQVRIKHHLYLLIYDITKSDAKLITSAGGNITDSYNNGFWTIQFDNFVDINTGKNLLK